MSSWQKIRQGPYAKKYGIHSDPALSYFTACLSCLPGKHQVSQGSPWGPGVKNHLPMQGAWIGYLVQKDPTCCGATKPMHHNY